MKISYKIIPFRLFCFFVLGANAQKIPNIQKDSQRAPTIVKIDGKASEWNNQFQAYNSSMNFFYTISNDDNNLYLILQSKNESTITKIILGGVSFSINNTGKFKDGNNITVTYPMGDRGVPPFFVMLKNRPKLIADKERYKMETDSFIKVRNQQIGEHEKLIGVIGFKSFPDSTISMYNTDGIKAASLLDDQIAYTVEVALPIKFIREIIGNKNDLRYNLRLNGLNGAEGKGNPHVFGTGRFIMYNISNSIVNVVPNNPDGLAIAFPTDFWGKYTLVGK